MAHPSTSEPQTEAAWSTPPSLPMSHHKARRTMESLHFTGASALAGPTLIRISPYPVPLNNFLLAVRPGRGNRRMGMKPMGPNKTNRTCGLQYFPGPSDTERRSAIANWRVAALLTASQGSNTTVAPERGGIQRTQDSPSATQFDLASAKMPILSSFVFQGLIHTT